MKRMLVCRAAISMGLVLLLAGACSRETASSKDKLSDTSFSRVLFNAELIVGVEDSIPPFAFRDQNGEMVGYDLDILRSVAQALQIRLVVRVVNRNERERLLRLGQIDCIAGGIIATDSLNRGFRLSKPYLQNGMVMVVRRRSSFKAIDDLAGRAVGIRTPLKDQAALYKTQQWYKDAQRIDTFETTGASLTALDFCVIDGVVTDMLTVHYAVSREKKDIRIIEEGLSTHDCVFVFRKDDASLVKKIEDTLIQLQHDQVLAAVSKKWFGGNISIIGQ